MRANKGFNKSMGLMLLGIWLIVTGLMGVVDIPIPALKTILAVIAIIAGALILFGKQIEVQMR